MKITEIKENEKNPRVIKGKKFDDLVKSLATFPEMLNLRPIVIDNDNMVLGGNMRLRALKHIRANPSKVDRLIADVQDEERRKYLSKYWADFALSGNVQVAKADELTEDQKREFIIKDNNSFGEWDWDVLANEWDNSELTSWGLDVWEDVNFDDTADEGLGEGNESNASNKASLADGDEESILYVSYRQSQAKALAEFLHVDVLGVSISADELLGK